ncbi:MAG: pilin [Patescibacteria group bacterium]|nr:pilin [Patescibacteria group bacterium]
MKLFSKYTILVIIIFFVFPSTNVFALKGCKGDEVCLNNPLTGGIGADSPNELIGQIINGVLGIVGSLALVMFIYGGFVWMLAAGSNEKVQKGKDILIWATIGLVVIFASYAIVDFVLRGITGKEKKTTQTTQNISK